MTDTKETNVLLEMPTAGKLSHIGECGIKYFTPKKALHMREHGNPQWRCWGAWLGEGGSYVFGDTAEEAWEAALKQVATANTSD